jgi:hypothetical protein
MMLSSPVWIVALVLAAAAPWFVRAFADLLELRVRKRTEALIARARARSLEPHGAGQEQARAGEG